MTTVMKTSRHWISVILVLVVTGCDTSQGAENQCHKTLENSTCVPITSKLCLGATLPIENTSIVLAGDSNSLDEIYDKLRLWSGLQNAPQCWQVVQPFLCSVYLPKCDSETKTIELPSKELCERTREPCKIVESFHGGWPEFLKCDQPHFVTGCKTDTYGKLNFNTSATCEHPLILTENQDSWFEDVPGCGIPCQNPLFTQAQHDEVHAFIAVFGSICLICTLFTVLTFVIDWRNASRYPALILFYINACFFTGSIGWLAQFAGEARRDIVCRADGTTRMGEPQLGSGESASCTIIFLMVYYTMMAGVIWFVMLAYSWYLTFQALGTPRDHLTKKTAYFHLISWLLPLVLSIICLAMSEIDGDSLSGICFVGYMKHGVRAGFVLAPISLVLITGLFFLIKGLVTLIKIRKEAPIFISAKATSKLRETIFRLGMFSCLSLVFVLITFSVHVYTFANEHLWRESYSDYYKCKANVTITQSNSTDTCQIKDHPSIVVMEIHVLAFFGAGIVMSSWSWNKASLSAWERFFRMVFNKPSNKPVKLKKHKMIAHAFQNRKNLNNGRMSISFHSTHDDPLGMKFDLNSASSHDMSSNFAAAMPKLVRRRGGLIHPVAGTGRRYSDSDVQSVCSRRLSADSLGPSLADFVAMVNEKKEKKKKKKRRKTKPNRIQPDNSTNNNNNNNMEEKKPEDRRDSNASIKSQMSTHNVRFSFEKRSIDALSLASSIPIPSDIEDVVMCPETKITPRDVPQPHYDIFTASTFLPENKEVSKFSRHLHSFNQKVSNMKTEMTETNFFSGLNSLKDKVRKPRKITPRKTPRVHESRLNVEPELESISD